MAVLRIGTCSWKYPSWEGLVYSRAEGIDYLEEYARRHSTVEIDQWFWTLPDRATAAQYASVVPPDFSFTVKAPQAVTLTHLRPRKGEDSGREIRFLDHLGTPWNRDEEGQIAQRAFGGMSVPRTVFAADKTGFFMLHALYDTLLSHPGIDLFHEHYVTDLIVKGSRLKGFLAFEMASGGMKFFAAKSAIIATGGFGRMYGFTTTAYSSTGDGIGLAYRAGLPLKDMEFVQFYPTGLIPTGVLITEAARGEGGYLLNSENARFMADYAKGRMELAPRDIIVRAMTTEMNQGRGLLHEVTGMSHLLLDLRHLGEAKIDERLPMIKEIAMKLLNINPARTPLPVRPAAHYTMGGIHVDLQGRVMTDETRGTVEGLWAAGECGCVSVHGANRLGSNSLSHCVVWGRLTGEAAARRAMDSAGFPPENGAAEEIAAAMERWDLLCARNPEENPYQLKRELGETLDAYVHVYRDTAGLARAREKVAGLRERFSRVGVDDRSDAYNTNLRDVPEIGNMIELAQAVIEGALLRKESRGSHAMVEYPSRDDAGFLKHTVAYRTGAYPRISYAPVAITKWQPMERKY